jgi:hypothetical protein
VQWATDKLPTLGWKTLMSEFEPVVAAASQPSDHEAGTFSPPTPGEAITSQLTNNTHTISLRSDDVRNWWELSHAALTHAIECTPRLRHRWQWHSLAIVEDSRTECNRKWRGNSCSGVSIQRRAHRQEIGASPGPAGTEGLNRITHV